jgi:hypothetical protein
MDPTHTEAIRHLLAEVEGLHERVAELEAGMESGMLDRLRDMANSALSRGGNKMDQKTVLEALHRFDKDAVATGTHELRFTLNGRTYTVKLDEGHGSATVGVPGGEQCKVATPKALADWIKGQRGVLAARAGIPEGSRLLRYTQAVLAQQGARPSPRGY